ETGSVRGDQPSSAASFLAGGGELGQLMRAHDWAATPLGPIEGWPQSLRTAISILLPSHAQIVAFWGPELVALYNDAYAPTIGAKHPQALGRPARENWSELWDILEPLLQGVMRSGEAFWARDYPFRIERHGYLEDVYFDIAYDPVRGEDGRVAGVFCTVNETTSRVLSERRLRTLHEVGTALGRVETAEAVGKVALDTMAGCNPADIPFALLYLLVDGSRARLVHAYGAEPRAELRELDLTAKDPGLAPFRAVLAHGVASDAAIAPLLAKVPPTANPELLMVKPVTASKRVAGFLVVGFGHQLAPAQPYREFLRLVAGQISNALTITRTLEEERRRAGQLERQVAAAIARREAAEAQLHQAQRMEAIGKLTGGVAHDFNNLLQVIGGNLQLALCDVADQPRLQQRLALALEGVERGAKLASQLLAFGRRQPLEPKVVDLGRFVRRLDDMLHRTLGEAIELETVVAGGLWKCLVDPAQFENALLNLAINARDAMESRGRLTIEVGNAYLDDTYTQRHPDVAPGQYVQLAVSDTGCGIAPELIERVFEPFFTTKPEGQGTGLGLSMVYGFAKQSDGHVKIYSEPGQGTTVRLYLPRSRAREDEDTLLINEPVQPRHGEGTVLVVEDDSAVRRTVVEMVAELGYRVLQAGDALAALAIIQSGVAIDLLFTDVVMPGPLRGPELARKAQEQLPDMAVLFTSGYTDNAIVHGGRLDEGTQLLSKPYTRAALARKLAHVLANHRLARAMATAAARTVPPPVRGPAEAAAAAMPANGRLRILLVEDDVIIRLTTADMLRSLGHLVREAGEAGEALPLLQLHPIDLLLADISLPGRSGVELAAEAVAQNPKLRVVFATGYDRVEGLDRHVELGHAVLLRKPYDQASLVQALATAMGASGKV
ncbi:MAG: response regulator, partial [Geminicoccaceae bacterium]